MVMLGAVQFQGTGDGIQDAVRNAVQVSPFQPRVVVHADSGQPRHFLAPEPRYTAAAAIGFDAGLLGGDPPTA
ncbi:hypothetical protein NicSoilC5_21930 [Arthrobacter sp. NicSoilC5]|nr:hypothetical protein NicSoilC5_21930 [Arthrobacter sp. NicSoilC5]